MTRKHIKYLDLMHYGLFLISFLIAFYTVGFHIGFFLMPFICFLTGFTTFCFLREKSLLIFLFFLPLINSFPALLSNGYPFNLMALVLFWLSGIIIGNFIFNKKEIGIAGFIWGKLYYLFLIVIWISALFVFVRWSNISFAPSVFFSDTPVSPGYMSIPRNSFASIYPVISLFLYTAAPFSFFLIRLYNLKKKYLFAAIFSGYFISVLIAVWQRFVNPGFLSVSRWSEKLNQPNGGFSDFNGFGIFSGILFLYSFLLASKEFPVQKKDLRRYLKNNFLYLASFTISLFGIFFSGSRTAAIFFIFAFIFFLREKKFKRKLKISIVILLIILVLITGSVLEKRIKKSFGLLLNPALSNDPVKLLDKVSNGRVGMIIDSIPMIINYPLSGVGTGNFIFYRKYLKHGENFMDDLPLNQYLLILDENGIPGILFFILFLMFLIGKDFILQEPGKIIGVIAIVLFVGNPFWLPEIFIFFWIVAGLGKHKLKTSRFSGRTNTVLALVVIMVFSISGILSNKSLNPSMLMKRSAQNFDFGFWEESTKSGFRWTKQRAGILTKLNEKGESAFFNISCGAPLKHLKSKSQKVIIKWKGKTFLKRSFVKNEKFRFKINGKPFEEGFLEIEVYPLFNLKKLGLGRESRDLGVMLFN